MDGIGAVAGSTNEIPYPYYMEASLLLRVRVFDEVYFGLRGEVRDFGDKAKLADARALVFEVEARELLGSRGLDNGLADFAELLVGVDLEERDLSDNIPEAPRSTAREKIATYHNRQLLGGMWQADCQTEEGLYKSERSAKVPRPGAVPCRVPRWQMRGRSRTFRRLLAALDWLSCHILGGGLLFCGLFSMLHDFPCVNALQEELLTSNGSWRSCLLVVGRHLKPLAGKRQRCAAS